MNQETAMLAALFEKSMNLGPEWTVTSAEFREGLPGGDELHIYISRTSGRAVECPSCGCRRGVYDTRPREWRHLDVWQYKTIVHCDVPRVDCPECGVLTARVPWASDDSARFTALFEAHALVMVMAGMTVRGCAKVLRCGDTTLWSMLNRLAARARAAADFSGVARVGVDETSRRKGHNYLTTFVDLDRQRAMFCCKGRDAGTVAAFAADLAAHGGDPAEVEAVTCDMSQVSCIVLSDTDRRSLPCNIGFGREKTRRTACRTQAPTPTSTGSSAPTTSYRPASPRPRSPRSSASTARRCSTGSGPAATSSTGSPPQGRIPPRSESCAGASASSSRRTSS